jgi:hypothetical protein
MLAIDTSKSRSTQDLKASARSVFNGSYTLILRFFYEAIVKMKQDKIPDVNGKISKPLTYKQALAIL